MVTLLAEPAAELARARDDDRVHFYCCDENFSLCGLDISDEPEVSGTPDERLCVACVRKVGLPCVLLGCPDRGTS